MTLLPMKPTALALFFIVLLLGTACNSDSSTLSDTDQGDSGILSDTDPAELDSDYRPDAEATGGSDTLSNNDVEEPLPGVVEYTITTEANTPVVIVPLGKIFDEHREHIVITDMGTPTMGSVVVNDNNTITYTPDTDKIGTDEFGYSATMTHPDSSVTTETGHITVIITEPEITHPTGDKIFYVTTGGKSANDGATEEAAWTIQHAFQTAKPGDVVHIKAGNYGALNLVVGNSGTETEPIKFIGYKEKPGDILATEGSTFKHGESTYLPADYPTLEGVRTNGKVEGTGITIGSSRKYIEVHNFQIKNKITGVASYGFYHTLNNIIVLEMGNYTGYSGSGIIMSGNYSQLTNSFVKNGVELITNKGGKYQLMDHNWAGCDQDINDEYSTDYYLMLAGSGGKGADHNVISNNTIYREPKQYHQGHGLIIKGHGQHNQFIDNTIINAPLEFSFEEVAYNTVTGGTITGTGATGDGGNVKYAFILLANGAHHNTFQDMTVTGDSGVRFSDWDDGWTPTPDTDAEDAGNNNLFKNIHFDNLITGVEFSWHWRGPGAASDNIFEDCIFTNIHGELFRTERPNHNTVFKNCTFSDNPATVFNQNGQNLTFVEPKGQKKPLDAKFEGCTFENNGFPTPQ